MKRAKRRREDEAAADADLHAAAQQGRCRLEEVGRWRVGGRGLDGEF